MYWRAGTKSLPFKCGQYMLKAFIQLCIYDQGLATDGMYKAQSRAGQ
jgi:hypothetical protein